MFNDRDDEIFELFISAAKYEIMNDNNGDYVGAYAEQLILNEDKDMLQKYGGEQ